MHLNLRRITLATLFCLLPVGAVSAQSTGLALEVTTIADDLTAPVAMAAVDGSLWVVERTGAVLRIDPATGEMQEIGRPHELFLPEAVGIVGMVLDPAFPEQPHIYLWTTYKRVYDEVNWAHLGQIVRYTYDPAGDTLLNPLRIVDSISTVIYNRGGGMAILPDSTLVFGLGDGVDWSHEAQRFSTTRGKVMRVNLDGSVPEDNPYPELDYPMNLVYSIGHRNPTALRYDVASERLVGTDWGTTSLDEINRIDPGSNLGWNRILGRCDGHPSIEEIGSCDTTIDPIYQYYVSGNETARPVDLLFAADSGPSAMAGRLIVPTLEKGLHAHVFSSDRTKILGHHEYATDFFVEDRDEPVRAIAQDADGAIYVATYREPSEGAGLDAIVRIDRAEEPEPIEAGEELIVREVVGDLEVPWEILWGFDNTIWMTERGGRVSRVDPVSGRTSTLLEIESVASVENTGLLGMALHPNFCDTPSVYLVYTWRAESGFLFERLVRYSYDALDDTLLDPRTILDSIPVSGSHAGSRIVIGRDRTIFMTISDADRQNDVQDYRSVIGTILRIGLDGSVPPDNPFADSAYPTSMIWSIGHRNPQGIVIAPDGTLYSSEHGPSTDDEINRIMPGRNYGWPDVAGYCDTPYEERFCEEVDGVEPLMAWTPTLAPAGLDYYDHDAIARWKDRLLLAFLKAGRLLVLGLDDEKSRVTSSREVLTFEYGRLRDVCVAPDGRVYVATSNRGAVGVPRPGDDRILELSSISGHPQLPDPGELCDRPDLSVPLVSGGSSAVRPQPARTDAAVSLSRMIVDGTWRLLDANGRLVRSGRIDAAEQLSIERRSLPAGYYRLQVRDARGGEQVSVIFID